MSSTPCCPSASGAARSRSRCPRLPGDAAGAHDGGRDQQEHAVSLEDATALTSADATALTSAWAETLPAHDFVDNYGSDNHDGRDDS